MKYLFYLLALAPWIFTPVMMYFSSTNWEIGYLIFLGASIIFACTGMCLLIAGLKGRRVRSIAAGVVVLLPPLLVSLGGNWWYHIVQVGEIPFQLTFIVVDDETQQPIANALVRLYDGAPVHHPLTLTFGKSEGRTEKDGRVSLVPRLTYTETNKRFRQSGWIRFSQTSVLITAEDYRPLLEPLEESAGSGKPLYDPTPNPPLRIGLKRKQVRDDDI